MRERALAPLLLAGWSLLIFWLCGSTEPLRMPRTAWMKFVQELAHAPLFGVHAALVLACVPAAARRAGRAPWLLAFATAVAYGGFIEWWQARVPGRSASAYDLVTDAVGAAGLLWIVASGRLLSWRSVVVSVAALVAAALAWAE